MKKIMMVSALLIGSYIGLAQKPAVVARDKEGWDKIGETKVNFKAEKDEIMAMGKDKYTSVKLKITDAAIILTAFEIYFDNDAVQKVTIEKEIKGPGETKEIKLDGGERNIKKVVFVYKTLELDKDKDMAEGKDKKDDKNWNKDDKDKNKDKNWGKDQKARVELWGYKVNGGKKTASK